MLATILLARLLVRMIARLKMGLAIKWAIADTAAGRTVYRVLRLAVNFLIITAFFICTVSISCQSISRVAYSGTNIVNAYIEL